MRRACLILVVGLLALGARASDLALVGATVYTDPDSAVIADAVVVISDGIIADVGPREQTEIPAEARVIDSSGTFVTAGFWNNHIHILTPTLLRAETASAAALNNELDAMLNQWGFTTVFDTASVLINTLALQRRIEEHEVRGPRIFTVGEPIWTETPAYARDFLETRNIEMPPVRTPQNAVRHVRSLASQGADGIKLFTGSLQRGRVAHMPAEVAIPAVEEAHGFHLPVFTHAQDAQGLTVAIEAGVDVLAHITPDTPGWAEELVSGSRLTGTRMALIPTLTLFDYESRRDGDSEDRRETLLETMVSQLRAFSIGGGEILFGTDVGYTDHFDTQLEFQLMARAGLNYRQILATLTTNPARQFGLSRRSGRVQRGFDADLVVLNGDPADDVRNFARVRHTIRGGEIIYTAR